ncbi:MAG TPA: type II toxin-antitoxin system RelB/DinJ family antitoxin [Coxiellaceae bacterium]|nr:MAG: addiction module antitoxin RelB [Gammaproteobacteria bacterium RIFCSPHIGHO2_12_FULL_36_30]HLB56051.1 type II toxin-antitoxin system RelB/DinJ family antitoxin [Coxiellaceae bacterium]
MHKEATVNARIEPKLKANAEHILHEVGLSSAEAVRLFYKQICLHKGLPFSVSIPNAITQQAMKEARSKKTHKAKRVKDIFNDLD